ncbi:NADPH:quinone oxidoreductase family protein [Aquisalimonas lutea]|uniref:NADPH:quinone oxidoreductase family protein n=1 Tax=Aquisalimonas lutea TaxID=1327750 RepID=UPI0025B2FA94|nr:NADPH:quinone oxidoreductase family protein [Aquisalimonas lutea]MDN3519777.1 NADPH:quinone oxidoreductase family protein [Aquisalimonas lutea]
MTATMRALLCREYGDVDDLVLGTAPVPRADNGQLLVRVHAAGLNFADALVVGGRYQIRHEPPFVPGSELSGEVIAIGEDITDFCPGDRVMAQVDIGAFADYTVVDARRAQHVPKEMSDDEAAAFYVAYGTAGAALLHRCRLTPSETVLVFGASSGVGLAALQVAKATGCSVIAGTRDPDKAAFVREQGADFTVAIHAEDARDQVRAWTESHGVDVVFDPVGGDATRLGLKCIAWEGRHVVVGFVSGTIPQIPTNHLLLKNADMIGFFWGDYYHRRPKDTQHMFERLFDYYRQGTLKPHIAVSVEPTEITRTLRAQQQGEILGKAVARFGL